MSKVYYQPEFGDDLDLKTPNGQELWSHMVYNNFENARRDFPDRKILAYADDDIENPYFIDDCNVLRFEYEFATDDALMVWVGDVVEVEVANVDYNGRFNRLQQLTKDENLGRIEFDLVTGFEVLNNGNVVEDTDWEFGLEVFAVSQYGVNLIFRHEDNRQAFVQFKLVG